VTDVAVKSGSRWSMDIASSGDVDYIYIYRLLIFPLCRNSFKLLQLFSIYIVVGTNRNLASTVTAKYIGS